MTANKPMTGEQLDELMTVAVNMQRDSEKANDRPAAMFAYAVQVAVLELRKVRDYSAALAAENAGLKSAIKEIVDSAEEAEYDGYFSFVVNPDSIHAGSDLIESETPATDAYLAEVRAQGVEMFAAWNDKHIKKGVEHKESLTAVSHAARGFAELIRKGVQS